MSPEEVDESTPAEAALMWADRFRAQGRACDKLGSYLYGRLLPIIADDIANLGSTWDVMSSAADLRFGQAGPLRLVGAAHRLAIEGRASGWAALLPSCGGTVPSSDDTLRAAWAQLVSGHAAELSGGLRQEVQTNEVGRAAGLGLGLAETGFSDCRLVEIGCSGGLNLRLDRFSIQLGDHHLGSTDSTVTLSPNMLALPVGELRLPRIVERVGIDVNPIDAVSDEGRVRLMSFVWPDQKARFERLAAALDIAAEYPARLVETTDTVRAISDALNSAGPRVLQHSIVWQYIPTAQRWKITELLESLGEAATAESPLAWIRYEPDEWNRNRAAIWLRVWPGGSDRLIAHVDFHGRWLEPMRNFFSSC